MTDRSYLFVPGDRPERFDKALAAGAHAVILDLEDAVTPERKDLARAAIAAWLQQSATPVFLRINPVGTPWHEADRELLSHAGLRGVMVPKAEVPAQLDALAERLRPGQTLLPLIETVAGHFAAADLARVAKVQRLAFGSVDFMADSGVQGDAEPLDAVRTHLVLVSRQAGLQAPIDGVSLAVNDEAQLERDALRSKLFGLGAKLCIHPKQVAAVHQAFMPTAQEVAWAQRVLAALASGPLGAIAVDGKLVDKPVALRAQAILDEAGDLSQDVQGRTAQAASA